MKNFAEVKSIYGTCKFLLIFSGSMAGVLPDKSWNVGSQQLVVTIAIMLLSSGGFILLSSFYHNLQVDKNMFFFQTGVWTEVLKHS